MVAKCSTCFNHILLTVKNKHMSILPTSLISIFFLVLLSPVIEGAAPSSPLFWEGRIEKALLRRNNIFNDLAGSSADMDITEWNPVVREAVVSAVFAGETSDNIWYPFLKGMLLYVQGKAGHEVEFTKALSAAGKDPGSTWLLFTEFDRYNLEKWAEKSLLQLEKRMFEEGGSTATIISQQLMQYGLINKKKHSMEKAHYYFRWAHRFNIHETASIVQRIFISSPFDLPEIVKTASELVWPIRYSWKVQAELVSIIYMFIRQVIFLFVLFVIIVLCVKYFPVALHRYAHFYPDGVPISQRTILVSGVVVSSSAFGIIPFIWFVSFLLIGSVSYRERFLLRIVTAALILFPLDSFVMERIGNALAPDGASMALFLSLNEGTSNTKVSTKSVSNEKVKLLYETSKALNEIKSNDLEAANLRLRRLLNKSPNDPLIINIKGILYFLGGFVDSAAACFKNVIELTPSDFTALFNLSRCSVFLNDATAGMEQLKKAAGIQPMLVNKFIEDNDRCFSDRWPPLRQLLFPYITPSYFWRKLFFAPVSSDITAKSFWGISFFGIPPLASFGLFLFLFLLLISVDMLNHNVQKVRRFFECKYCGRIVCRRCSSGILCGSCENRIQQMNLSKTIEQIRENIILTHSLMRDILSSFLNAVIPGAGDLLRKKTRFGLSVAGIALSSIVYAWWYSLYRDYTFQWAITSETALVISFPLLINLYFLGRYIPSAVSKSNSLLQLLFSKERSADGIKRNIT